MRDTDNESGRKLWRITDCFCVSVMLRHVVVIMLLVDRHAFGGVVWDVSGQLHNAAQNGNAVEVRALLKENPNLVSSIDIDTNTPLHLAVEGGHEDIVKLLLADKAEVNAKNKLGETPLDLAAIWGETKIAKVLLAYGARINDGALNLAVSYHHKSMVELLLANGADANARDNKGNTPLDLTWEPEIADLLLAGGANVNAKDSSGKTALYKAQDMAMAKWLINHKAQINARDANGDTPLVYAALWGPIWGDEKTVELLVANGADVTAKGTHGETALFLTAQAVPGQPDPGTARLMATNAIAIQKDFVKLLLAHGADINGKGPEGYTPLHAAVLAENKAIVEYLLANKADVNAKGNKGDTPLRLAIENTNDDIAIVLRQHGGRE